MRRTAVNGVKEMICYLRSIQILPVVDVGFAIIRVLINFACSEEITPIFGRYSSNGTVTVP